MIRTERDESTIPSCAAKAPPMFPVKWPDRGPYAPFNRLDNELKPLNQPETHT